LLGTVAEVAKAWGLGEQLGRAAGLGEAFEECLKCRVEASRRAKVQAGVAYPKERRIVLNAQLLVPGREADRDATLLHECAHVIADLSYGRNCRHSWRWRQVIEMLGEPPEVCHRLDYLSRQAHAVVTWICTGCGEEYHFVRTPKRRIKQCYCRLCGPEDGRLRVGEALP
jgi:SprT protein